MNRLESLDWLRGLLALSIMVYHLTGWKFYQPESSELLGRLGIYGVSMFFVLSGLSMAAGYAGFIRDGRTSVLFFIRRIFRIWPLLWVAVATATLAGFLIKGEAIDWKLVLLNVTTLFGFVSPGAYINTGAWSIGNEMVYYAMTPALLALYNRSARYGNVAVAATVAIGMWFAFFGLVREATLTSQWKTYIHPLNNLMFYATGVALYYNVRHFVLDSRTSAVIMLASLALLTWYPAGGDLVNIVTGVARVAFLLSCIGIVLGFYKLSATPPRWVSRPLAALGVATYGVYLLHPLVYQAVVLCDRMLGLAITPVGIVAVTVCATTGTALVVYELFESPLIRLGKRLTSDSNLARRPDLRSTGPN